MSEVLLEIKNVTKRFPGVVALSDVSFSLDKGEVRGLVGENGAGKSTLIKSIMQVHRQDEGIINYYYNGQAIQLLSPLDAREKGVLADYQDVAAAKELSVTENYFMGRLITRVGIVQWAEMHKISKKRLEEFGITDIDPRAKMSSLSLAKQAMVVISKLIYENPKLIIFDEPTASLTNEDCEILFRAIRKLKEQGVGILYISHRLEEILDLCDNITVLKDGQCVGTYPADELDEDKLITLMVGRNVGDIYNIKRAEHGDVVMKVENLTRKDKFNDVSFELHKGEILGLFGLIGSGRTEIVRALFGADKIDSGTIILDGKAYTKITPKKALEAGLGLATEDRKNQGLATMLSIEKNVNSASYGMISRMGCINLSQEKKRALEYKEKLRIRTPSIYQLISNLSGGNQQKVVISKLMCRDPKVLIFDEPTVGIDVGAKSEIFNLIEEMIHQGKAVLVISSYMPELMGLSDRILAISNGRITGEFKREEFNEEALLKAASLN